MQSLLDSQLYQIYKMLQVEIIILVGMFLMVMSLLDIWKRTVPSIFPSMIILFLIIAGAFANGFTNTIYFGVLSFVFGWLLYEFDLFRGVADLKTTVIVGLTLSSLNQFYVYMTFLPVIATIYNLLFIKVFKLKKGQEVPFLPVFLAIYIILMTLIYLL